MKKNIQKFEKSGQMFFNLNEWNGSVTAILKLKCNNFVTLNVWWTD